MRKKILNSIFVFIFAFIGISIFSSEINYADMLTVRQNYYRSKGFEPAPGINTSTEVRIQSDNGSGGMKTDVYKYSFGHYQGSTDSSVANVEYYINGNDRVSTIFSKGSAGGGGAKLLLKSGISTAFVPNRQLFMKSNDGKTLVGFQKSGDYLFEMSMGPDPYEPSIRTEFHVWNDTNKELTYGIFYHHDAQLGEDDHVPVKSLGANRGMYISDSKSRLNYTFEKYRDKTTNFAAAEYFKEFDNLTRFGNNPSGKGVEDRSSDNPNDVFLSGQDSTLQAKMSPTLIKPGESSNFSFTTGVGEASSRPKISTDVDNVEVGEGEVARFTGFWEDYETQINQKGKIDITWEGTNPAQIQYKKTKRGYEFDKYGVDIQTAGMPPGDHNLLFKITDGKGQIGTRTPKITILPKMKIEQRIKGTSTVISTINTEQFGKPEQAYSVDLPLITPDNKYLIDKGTTGYAPGTGKLTGKWTEAEVAAGKKVVDYYPVPTLTANPVADIKETDNGVEITGNWTDATKAGGKVEIKKGATSVGSTTYAANVANGTWKVTVPKEQLAIGQNNLTVTLSHGYSSYTKTVPVTVHRQKHVKINYYLFKNGEADTLLPNNILTDLPREAHKRVGDVVTVEAKPFLEGQKYKFDPIKSGIPGGSGFTVTTNVTATLNEVKVYYVLNQVPVEIQYNNIETGKAIFETLNSETRKPAKPLGLQIVGTDVNTLIQAGDKAASGYTFHSIKVKKGNTDVQNGQVGDEPTVISILFKPKFIVEPPVLNFGEHKLSVFDTTKTLEGNPQVKITNTRETASGKITPWKVTGEFSGFTIGTQNKLASELKYGDASFSGGRSVTIDSEAVPTAGEKSVPLSSKMKLNVNGGGTIVGEYNGTMTWTLTDAL